MVKATIRSNSTKILNYLEQKEESPVSEIRDQLDLKTRDVYLAIGWLACENKVHLRQDGHRLIIILNSHPHSFWF
ncbi:MAG: winged helix-turn-helix domain-containing protein [Mangrovibacterium sp.]